jgi:hypothetical protein
LCAAKRKIRKRRIRTIRPNLATVTKGCSCMVQPPVAKYTESSGGRRVRDCRNS